MLTKIDELLNEVQKFHSQKKEEIEQFRIKFNGKKGILNDLFEQFKSVSNDQKKEYGQKINLLKQSISAKLEELTQSSSSQNVVAEK